MNLKALRKEPILSVAALEFPSHVLLLGEGSQRKTEKILYIFLHQLLCIETSKMLYSSFFKIYVTSTGMSHALETVLFLQLETQDWKASTQSLIR